MSILAWFSDGSRSSALGEGGGSVYILVSVYPCVSLCIPVYPVYPRVFLCIPVYSPCPTCPKRTQVGVLENTGSDAIDHKISRNLSNFDFSSRFHFSDKLPIYLNQCLPSSDWNSFTFLFQNGKNSTTSTMTKFGNLVFQRFVTFFPSLNTDSAISQFLPWFNTSHSLVEKKLFLGCRTSLETLHISMATHNTDKEIIYVTEKSFTCWDL